MRILVTGANGYLGQGIVDKLLCMNQEVIATDLDIGGINNNAVKISCNLFEVEDPYTFFAKPQAVLHLAWRDGFIHNSKKHIEDLSSHVNFIQKLANSNIEKIAIMGSMHEIGFFEGSVVDNTPCRPETMYGIAKNALRDAAKIICEQNNIVFQWFRAYYIVGNKTDGSSIFSKIMKAASDGKKTFPFTSGCNQYDFLDYDQFCIMTAKAVSQNEVNGIINICSGQPEKLSNRVEWFIKSNNLDIKLNYGAYPDRKYDSKALWGDDSKIKTIMSLKDLLV